MTQTERKRPVVAAALALLSPGLGHVYLREWFRALLWFGLVLSTTQLLIPAEAVPTALSVEAFTAAAEAVPLRSWVAVVGLSTLSMADAYWMATAGNRRASTEGPVCPSCGKELDEDLSFCHWCTERLDGT